MQASLCRTSFTCFWFNCDPRPLSNSDSVITMSSVRLTSCVSAAAAHDCTGPPSAANAWQGGPVCWKARRSSQCLIGPDDQRDRRDTVILNRTSRGQGAWPVHRIPELSSRTHQAAADRSRPQPALQYFRLENRPGALMATEVALEGGVAPSTASAHLARLERQAVLAVVQQG